MQLERKVKTAYTAKLRAVLLAIAADHGQIPDVEELLDGGSFEDGQVYFHADGRFTVTDIGPSPTERDVVQLTAELDGARLHLSCSLGHFSEGDGEQYGAASGTYPEHEGVVTGYLDDALRAAGPTTPSSSRARSPRCTGRNAGPSPNSWPG